MSATDLNPTTRFSDRVGNYVKYRPTYPVEVLGALKSNCGLTESSVIADVGSGTGILTQMLLENSNPVFAIEPNAEMRAAADNALGSTSRFTSVAGTAEATTLPDAAVDFIIAAQAFHWFDRAGAKIEFRRILRPDGWVVLIWNEREMDSSPFLREYEALLQTHATDYHRVNHTNLSEEILHEFYAPGTFSRSSFPNSQNFDWEGLKGRCLSSSYAPNEGQSGHDEMMAGLKELFDKHESGGAVTFEYRTNVYFGRINESAG